jgi:hypothetical protein
MRKSWLFIIALVTLGFLAGAAGAATVQISGRHGMGEIASTCASVGGTFSSVPVLRDTHAVEHLLVAKNCASLPVATTV